MKISKKNIKEMYSMIEYYYGKRCTYFNPSCLCCVMYYLMDKEDYKHVIEQLDINREIQDEVMK